MTKKMAAGQSLQSMGSKLNDAESAFDHFKKVNKGALQHIDSSAPDVRTPEVNHEAEWTQAQQKQLEDALRKYPPGPCRWTAIAKEVDGKGKKACQDRFRWIREEMLNNNKDNSTTAAKTSA